MNIQYKPITSDNWRIFTQLKVKDEQKAYVAPNTTILAKAYAYRENNSLVYAIYDEDLPIGLLMQRDYMKDHNLICILDQFMISEQYQGLGYGKEALQLWISMVKAERKYVSIMLCYIDKDEIARNLYLRAGFLHTGENDEDEIGMEFKLIGRSDNS